MKNLHLVAARGAGRSFPVYPRTVSIYSNNYRKLHGMPMMRHVHLRKIEKKKVDRMIEEWIKWISGHMNVYDERKWFGIDLAKGHDFSIDISDRYYPIYGQPVINQKAVVKIVTSGEE